MRYAASVASHRRGARRAPIPATSLRTRFLWLFLGAGLALAGLTFVVFESTARAIASHYATRYATREALLQQSRVRALVEREVALAVKLADDPTLRNWAAREGDPALRALAMQDLESYRRAFRSRSYFVALHGSLSYLVYDPKPGVEAVRTTRLTAGAPSDRWYFETLQRDRAFELNVDRNVTLDAVKVWVNVVMRDRAGRPMGIAGTGIDLTDFLDRLHSGDGEARTMLVDGRGIVEAHWDRAIVERNAQALSDDAKTTVYGLLSPEDGVRLRGAIAGLAAGGVHVMSLQLDGRPHLAAVTALPEIGWYGLVLLDASQVLSARRLLPILLAMAAGALALLAVLVVVLDRLLLRPVARLTAAAHAVAGGDYRVHVPDARRDELGLLARTFNAMTASLGDYTTRLQEMVAARTRELGDANAALRASQARIDESLRCARELQAALLPSRAALEAELGPPALVFRPRDEVGGDVYHVAPVEGGAVAAVVDCTGHGVPGAFISMIASSVLKHAHEDGTADPRDLLVRLDRGVRDVRQPGALGELDAGLDVVACRLDHRTRTLTVAGAGLPAFLVQGGEVIELAGDRHRVGYAGSAPRTRFAAHVLAPPSGARVYLVSDGVLDHPGGERGFGFGGARLKALLASLAAVPMAEHGARIEAALRDWAGGRPQRDDLTLLGFELRWRR